MAATYSNAPFLILAWIALLDIVNKPSRCGTPKMLPTPTDGCWDTGQQTLSQHSTNTAQTVDWLAIVHSLVASISFIISPSLSSATQNCLLQITLPHLTASRSPKDGLHLLLRLSWLTRGVINSWVCMCVRSHIFSMMKIREISENYKLLLLVSLQLYSIMHILLLCENYH